jgi:hypothetical protein
MIWALMTRFSMFWPRTFNEGLGTPSRFGFDGHFSLSAKEIGERRRIRHPFAEAANFY